ncbi:MAG: MetS family NSS transporter small subunit [bacterium]|nr:MetS family NSS transporter small subunit [bacterium]
MPTSAWIMLIFGCLVLYGGLGICLRIATRKRD